MQFKKSYLALIISCLIFNGCQLQIHRYAGTTHNSVWTEGTVTIHTDGNTTSQQAGKEYEIESDVKTGGKAKPPKKPVVSEEPIE